MQDLANGQHGCTVFSKINLVKGDHQVPIVTADIPKTAIITPFGLFEWAGPVLAVLAANGLTIKCTFMVSELEVLGHIISKSGTTRTPQQIQVIIEYPPPQDAKQLQSYLRMVSFYLRFKPGIAATLEWIPALDSAFQSLAHPAPNAAMALASDASETHPHRWRTPPEDTRLLATIGFLFSQATTFRIEIRNV